MRLFFVWFQLSCKRYCVKLGFWISFLILPAFCLFLQVVTNSEKSEGTKVAMYLDADEDAVLEHTLFEMLEKNVRELSFYLCDSEEEAKEHVASKKADCGVIVRGDLAEKISAAEEENIFEMLSSPSSSSVRLCEEYVYSQYASMIGSEVIVDAIAEELRLEDEAYEEMKLQVEQIYARMMAESDYHLFEYVDMQGEVIAQDEGAAKNMFPVRGFVAVYLLMVGLFGCSSLRKDRENGIFMRFSGVGKLVAEWISLFAVFMMLAASALVGLVISGVFTRPLLELGSILLYCVSGALFCLLCSKIIRNEKILIGMIPVFVLACFILCPIFIDVGGMIPLLGKAEKWFLPTYYLRIFE